MPEYIEKDVLKRIQQALAYAAKNLDGDVSLDALAAQARMSTYHLHRTFLATAGETPKQFTLRLRLGRAAAMLVATRDSVLDIALACGFQSHEVFTRAFRKRFGITPSAYRSRGRGSNVATATHAALVERIAPCIGLFHVQEQKRQELDMAYSITKKEIQPQPVVAIRRRIKPSELAATLGEVFGVVFQYLQKNGIALAGPPYARYFDWGPGLGTIEAGFPVAANSGASPEGEVRFDTLPGGPVAITTHAGSYDTLSEAHAAIQRWMEAEKLEPAGAPWESYTTDPGNFPDPKDWKTDVVFPVRAV
ncbi:MAG TPA: AraC family transcriptional regulator [Bryobacteraceae bacterium]|nr:AraC family transcriptional regulator [Bryobacteraceae bacterium]